MPAPDDQQPVQALGTDRADPALRMGVGIRRLHRCQQHLGAFCAEHLVEGTAELRIPVAEQEAHPSPAFLQRQQQVAGLLGDPGVFIQIMQGRATNPDGIRTELDRWKAEFAPGADGWLGSTAGITDDGYFIAVVRFASEELARQERDASWPLPCLWPTMTPTSFA
jgi:hypothetical protein